MLFIKLFVVNGYSLLATARIVIFIDDIDRQALVQFAFIDQSVKVGTGAVIGQHGIFHVGAIIGIDAKIGDFVQVGPGSIISPGVSVEDEVFIGSGVTIVGGVSIGKGARIGAGSVVVTAVKAGDTVFGNPAQKVNS